MAKQNEILKSMEKTEGEESEKSECWITKLCTILVCCDKDAVGGGDMM